VGGWRAAASGERERERDAPASMIIVGQDEQKGYERPSEWLACNFGRRLPSRYLLSLREWGPVGKRGGVNLAAQDSGDSLADAGECSPSSHLPLS